MGVFAPVVGWLGANAGAIATTATVISGALAGRQQYIAGKEAQITSRMEAQQERDAARGREIERKRGLLRALATQSAVAGAQGVAFSGGKAAIARADIRDAVEDLMVDRVNTNRRIFALGRAGNAARKAGYVNAAVSLLDTAGNVFSQLGPKKK